MNYKHDEQLTCDLFKLEVPLPPQPKVHLVVFLFIALREWRGCVLSCRFHKMTVGAGRRSPPTATAWGTLVSVGGCIVACDMIRPAYGCNMLPKMNLSLMLGSHWNLMQLTAWIQTWKRAKDAQDPSAMSSTAAPGDVWTGSIESLL